MTAPTVKLNSGYDMPLVGFGLWKVNNGTCADQIYEAIKAGYRCFDGACGMFQTPTSFSTSRTNTRNFQTTATRSKPGKALPAPSKTAS